MSPAVRRRLPFLPALAAVGVFLGILAATDRMPAADGPHMLFVARKIGDDLFALRLVDAVSHWVHLAIPHPPAAYLPSILVSPWLPLRAAIGVSSAFCLLLLLDALVRIARPSSTWMAVAAWGVGCASGLTWWSGDHYGFDLPTAAAVLQAVSWLHASDVLRKGRETLFFGLWLGVAFLTKYSAPLILVLPVAAVCAVALFRRPLRVGIAAGGWVAIAGTWLLVNGTQVLGYVTSALFPPRGPGHYPHALSALERFGGEGQVATLAALKDAIGYPGLVVCAISALVAGRAVPLLGLLSGVVLLGSMNSREGRYVLPLVFLLAAAAIPRSEVVQPARRWAGVVLAAVLGIVGIVGFSGSALTYHEVTQVLAPSNRPYQHFATTFATLGGWPRPAGPFSPVSEHPSKWHISEVLDAMVAAWGTDATVLLLLDMPPDAPGLSTYALLSRQRDLDLSFIEVHAQRSPQGIQTLTTLPPGHEARSVYVVTRSQGDGTGRAWLDQNPGAEVGSWELPEDYVGRAVTLATPYRQGAVTAPFQGGTGGR